MELPDYVQTDARDLVRETRSGALLNTNRSGLQRARAQRAHAHETLRTVSEVKTLRTTVSNLEAKIELLTGLVLDATSQIKR